PGLERLVRRCLEKRPEERFQSASDIGFALEAVSSAPTAAVHTGARRPRSLLVGGAVLGVACGLALGYVGLPPRSTVLSPSFKQLTFRRGVVHTARFDPEGHTILYGAAWEGKPTRVFAARVEGPESSPLDLPEGNVAAVSTSGELAMLTGRIYLQ